MNRPNPPPTAEAIRDFLLGLYADKLTASGRADIPDSFDLLLEGIIDSMGVLEMVGALEKQFQIELDLSGLDTEQITLLGPLSRYVAAQVATAQGSSA